MIRDFHPVAIPEQLSVKPLRDDTQQDHFRERTGVVKVRASRFTSFAGTNPVPVVARRTTQKRVGEFVLLHAAIGKQPGPFSVSTRSDNAFLANEERSVISIAQLGVFINARRPRGHLSTVVPCDRDGRHIASRWKFKTND